MARKAIFRWMRISHHSVSTNTLQQRRTTATHLSSLQTFTFFPVKTAGSVNTEYIFIKRATSQNSRPARKEGQAETCQVKKGMSPSCKHFLSGREHFLNPGATKPFCIFYCRQWFALYSSYKKTKQIENCNFKKQSQMLSEQMRSKHYKTLKLFLSKPFPIERMHEMKSLESH